MKCIILNKDSLTKEIKDEIILFRKEIMSNEYSVEKDEWTDYDTKSYHFLVHMDHKLVGYYRLRIFNQLENEILATKLFSLNKLFECTEENKIAELSRAAIHPEYRNGIAISLLWLHISKFFQDKNIYMSIGCTSLNEWSHDTYSYIFKENLVLDLPVLPHKIPQKIRSWEKMDENDIKKKNVRTLIRAYGKQGALFCPFPAFDEEWKSYDFFTVFKTHKLKQRFKNL